jgi:hypothetical protein
MDFISKFEQEDRQKAELERSARQQAERKREDAAIQFVPVVARLRPLLEERVNDIAERLGIQLNLSIGELGITITAPKRGKCIYGSSPFPFSVVISPSAGGLVRVCAKDDQSMPGRPYEQMPDDMSYGDYYGSVVTVASTPSSIDELESGDLEHLLEWLVACSRSGSAPPPHLKSADRRQKEASIIQSDKEGRISNAGWCLGLAIVSTLFFPYIGPVLFIWGVSIRRKLVEAGEQEGRLKVAWAIGLGAWSSLVVAIQLVIVVLARSANH